MSTYPTRTKNYLLKRAILRGVMIMSCHGLLSQMGAAGVKSATASPSGEGCA